MVTKLNPNVIQDGSISFSKLGESVAVKLIQASGFSETLADVATSGSYNDLLDKPEIPNPVTETTVGGWGFTKNVGTVVDVKLNNTNKSPVDGTIDFGFIHKELVTTEDSNMTLSPNIYYRNTNPYLSSLNISFGGIDNDKIINEYLVEFTTSAAGTTISLQSSIK